MSAVKNILFIFPGQGSQYAGIGSDLCEQFPAANAIYETASDIAGYDLKTLSFSDPDNKINLTRYTQPVLLTHSIACLEAFNSLTENTIKPQCVAGHSLGEYSALVASGKLSFEAALSAVIRRGELMSELGKGEMTAFSMTLEDIKPVAEKFYCGIAGCNMTEQTVVGGDVDDLNRLEQYVTENFERKRFARLKTEGAFHTYYMVDAAREFRKKLDQTEISPSDCQVLSNYTGSWHENDAKSIKSNLFYQLFNPVLWQKNLLTAYDSGIDTIIEFGGGIGNGLTPADKRPNLESIIKKTFRRHEVKPAYFSVINSDTLKVTATSPN